MFDLLIGIRLDWDLVFFMVYPAGYSNNKTFWNELKDVKDQAEVTETTGSRSGVREIEIRSDIQLVKIERELKFVEVLKLIESK